MTDTPSDQSPPDAATDAAAAPEITGYLIERPAEASLETSPRRPLPLFYSNVRPIDPRVHAGKSLPVVTYSDGLSLHFNGEEVRVFHVPEAHTDGDSAVWFEGSNAVHLGDLYFQLGYPFVDVASGGNVLGLIEGLRRILPELPADVRVIPGHGQVTGKAELEVYRAADCLEGRGQHGLARPFAGRGGAQAEHQVIAQVEPLGNARQATRRDDRCASVARFARLLHGPRGYQRHHLRTEWRDARGCGGRHLAGSGRAAPWARGGGHGPRDAPADRQKLGILRPPPHIRSPQSRGRS